MTLPTLLTWPPAELIRSRSRRARRERLPALRAILEAHPAGLPLRSLLALSGLGDARVLLATLAEGGIYVDPAGRGSRRWVRV